MLEDTVVLPLVRIGRGVRLRRTIVDKRCVLPDGLQIGYDAAQDRARFRVSERGIVLVTPDMRRPPSLNHLKEGLRRGPDHPERRDKVPGRKLGAIQQPFGLHTLVW